MTNGRILSAAGALVGAAIVIAGVLVAPAAIAISYLVALTATLAVVTGTLLLVMIAHLSNATWFVLLRRRAEAVVGALPALAVLAVPLMLVPHALWPWAAPFDALPAALQEALRYKRTYFQPAFFIARAIVYWIVWVSVGERLRRASLTQDTAADRVPSARFRALSAAGIPLVALAMTFASFDWMMSLSPAWSSTLYGLYYVIGGLVSAVAVVSVLARVVPAARDEWSPTPEHVHALGSLTLAFVLLWGYLWYSQFFIIWIADIPREAAWLLDRMRGGWRVVGLAVLANGFAVPVCVLLFRAAKRSAVVMALLGVWLVAVHYVDTYWVLVPSVRREWSPMHLLWDLGAVAFIAGTAAAVAMWRHSTVPPVAVGDPLLHWSSRYEMH